MWASSWERRGLGTAVAALAPLLALACVAAGSVACSLPLSRLPAGAAVRVHVQVGARATGRGAAAGATPAAPQPVIPPGFVSVHVPILEYHYIRINPNPRDRLGFNLSVTPSSFRAQMTWLAAHRYHPIDLADLRAYFAGQVDLPSRPVVLTFDDGYEDFYATAWPVLRALGFTAVSYVVPGFLGRQGYMTATQVGQLDRAGIEIGSHTVHHVDLTRVDSLTMRIELQASKGFLEHLLGHPVLDFCYPSGRFDKAAEAAVGAAGYQSATTEQPGTIHSWDGRLAWTRVRVAGGEMLSAFAASLGPSDPTQVVTDPRLPPPSTMPSASPEALPESGNFP